MATTNKSITLSAVFLAFLKLGLTSFGGPIAHIGYFRTEFVERRKWLSEQAFAQLLATCQFLPGPASSQLGFSIGLVHAGWLGAIAAFIAFTMPSVLLLIAFASALPLLSGEIGQAVVHGLKLVACVIVADAVISMAKSLCPDLVRRIIALAALIALLLSTSIYAQLAVLAVAAIIGGFVFPRGHMNSQPKAIEIPYGTTLGTGLLVCFFILLVSLPVFTSSTGDSFSVAGAFYRAGALVFGGGHVVLPLLEDSVVVNGWLTTEQFLAGYGASQAIPGPMFAFAAYIGAAMSTDGYALAMIALVFMFLPGFLLIAGVLPFWQLLSQSSVAAGIIAAVNAAVVGLLAAALYDPIFTSGIANTYDMVIALVGLIILLKWRVSPLIIVVFCITTSFIPLWISLL